VPAERRLVSAVIDNRLKEEMPLAIDATLRYGLGIPGNRPLTKQQLQSNSPYNTRRFKGLPPTPIGNPGVPSMRAAARPAPRNYLYFLRKPNSVRHFLHGRRSGVLREGPRVRLRRLLGRPRHELVDQLAEH
jgi:UPF0755 protein